MDSVLSAAAVYLALLLILRVSGKRTVGDISTFDFVLLLIISESVQQAMVGRDQSLTHGLLLVTTLVGLDVALSLWRRRGGRLPRWLEPAPLVVLADGQPLRERMWKTRVDVHDILAAAREHHGVERLDQIKYAIVERNGGISIIPR